MWCGDDLVTRSTNELRAVDPGDGATRWRTAVDPDGGSGHFLCAFGKVALTDRRPDPKHLTQVVGVRGGKVSLRVDLRCTVGQGATAVAAGMLFAVGHDPATGDVLTAVDLETGAVKIDVQMQSDADGLLRADDRLVVLNRTSSPGLYSLRPDGTDLQFIERRRAHDMKLSAERLLATLADEAGDTRYVQARDASTMRELWSAPAYGPACGLDGDAAVHGEDVGGRWAPVLRNAASGDVRWRGEPLDETAGSIQFAAGLVLVTRSLGMRAYARDDGRVLGEYPLGRTALAHDGRLYLGAFRSLLCSTLD